MKDALDKFKDQGCKPPGFGGAGALANALELAKLDPPSSKDDVIDLLESALGDGLDLVDVLKALIPKPPKVKLWG